MSLPRFLQSLLIISLLNGGSSWAATYWVSKQGSDSNSCFASNAQPDLAKQSKRTIMGGAACLRNGDTLMIMPGDYNEWLDTPLPSGGTLRSADPNPTNWFVLKPHNNIVPHNTAAIRFNNDRSNVTLKYIKIDLSSITSGNKPAQCLGAGNNNVSLTLEDFECIGPAPGMASDTGSGIGITSGAGAMPTWAIRRGIIKNFINQNGSPGAHGIYWQGGNSLVENVWIENVNGRCLNLRTSYDQSNNIFRYSVCKDAAGGPIVANSGGGSTNNVLHNNVFWNANRVEILRSGQMFVNNTIYGTSLNCARLRGSNHVVQNNIFLNCGSTAILNESSGSILSHNLTSGTASKIFIDADKGNFRLVAGSPAIDAGTTVTAITRDLVGTTRPQGCCYDIGAFEFSVGGIPPVSPSNVDITAK